MASSSEREFENALNMLVNVTEKSGKLRNDYKKDIVMAVSILRKEMENMMKVIEEKNSQISKLETEVTERNSIMAEPRAAVRRGEDGETSRSGEGNYEASEWRSAQPGGSRMKRYADVVQATTEGNNLNQKKMFKLFVKSKCNQSAEYSKTLLKTKINPTEMKIGINGLKTLKNGQLLIESECRNAIDKISKQINEVCGGELESYTPKLINPRIIIFNVPDDTTCENVAETIASQNSEFNLKGNDISAKFVFKDRKKYTNLVVEVNSEIRKRIVGNKLKLGWNICNSADYFSVRRCYKCSKYNHKANDCKEDVVCPQCAQNHKLSECRAEKESYRCINCIIHNKYYKTAQVNETHSSLDKSCSCYISVLRKYKERIDY